MATDKNNKIKTEKQSGARRNLTDIRLYGRHSFAPLFSFMEVREWRNGKGTRVGIKMFC